MRFILDFVADTATATIDEYIAENNCTVIQTLSELGLIYLVECDSSPASEPFVEIIEDDPGGISLLSSDTKTFDIENDDHWWKVAVIPELDLGVSTAEIIRVGEGVRVYLLDSGIAADHPEFANKDIALLHSKTGEFSDSTGHGTALASVIVGETCGISEASLKIVKVFQQGQPTLISEILAAMNAVAEDFMLDDTRPAIMNLSWAINKNAYVEAKILSLINKGIIVIGAAGNSGISIDAVTPASMPEIVTVGSFGPNLTPSNFSNYTGPSDTSFTAEETNYGVGLDLFAPGEFIRIAKTDGTYGYTAGTSIAAAIASATLVVNLASYDSTYAELDYSITVMYTRGQFVIQNLLALDGNFANSPNRIPKARLKTYDPDVDLLPIVKPYLLIKAGTEFSNMLFNANYFTNSSLVSSEMDGITLSHNWVKGLAPATETVLVKKFTYEAFRENGTSNVVEVVAIIYNESTYEDNFSQMLSDANYIELQCGCPPEAQLCCGDCVKGISCNNCQLGVSGSCDNN